MFTRVCAGTSRAAAIKPHAINAIGKGFRCSTAESYQYTHSCRLRMWAVRSTITVWHSDTT